MSFEVATPPKNKTGKIIAFSCLAISLCILLIPVSIGLWYLGLQSKVVWKYEVKNPVLTVPLVVDDTLYFGSLRENIDVSPAFYALDLKTGTEIWKKPIGASVFSTPVSNNELVFFSADDGFFYGLDRKTGQERWVFGPEQRGITSPGDCEPCELKLGTPIIAGGMIYVGSYDQNLYALDALTGELKWKFKTNGSALNAPAFVGGKLYLGGKDVYVLDPQTGKEVKRYLVPVDSQQRKYESNGVFSTPIVDPETVYVVNGMLLALDAETGIEKWRIEATTPNLIMTAAPFDDRIIVSTSEYIRAVDKETGQKRWNFSNIKGSVFFAPTIYQGSVYFGDSEGYLYRVNAKTGRLIEKFHLNLFDLTSYTKIFGNFVFTPTIQDKVVYVGWNNYVYAIHAK